MLNKAILSLIKGYQHTLSPDHGLMKIRYPHGACRFYPSCSVYTAQAITTYGTARGLALGAWRILRCNPWSRGGVDEVNDDHRHRPEESQG